MRKPCYNTYCHKEGEFLDCYLAGECPLFMDEQSVCCCDMPEKKKTTNYDRIVAMTVEEMAEFYSHMWCPQGRKKEKCRFSSCKDCWLDWLREEVET